MVSLSAGRHLSGLFMESGHFCLDCLTRIIKYPAMKKRILYQMMVMTILITVISGCKKKNEEPNVLSNSYHGTMTLEYSRGFPNFSSIVQMNIDVAKNGAVTFGPGDSVTFDKEEIKYNQSKPEIKMKMTGTLGLHAAKGQYFLDKGVSTLMVWVHSSIVGQMTVWSWDDDLGWVQVLDTPYNYEDTYNDGSMQFNINDAVLTGSFIKTSLPDIQDTATYGYALFLTPELN
jgi:hypothetical protein